MKRNRSGTNLIISNTFFTFTWIAFILFLRCKIKIENKILNSFSLNCTERLIVSINATIVFIRKSYTFRYCILPAVLPRNIENPPFVWCWAERFQWRHSHTTKAKVAVHFSWRFCTRAGFCVHDTVCACVCVRFSHGNRQQLIEFSNRFDLNKFHGFNEPTKTFQERWTFALRSFFAPKYLNGAEIENLIDWHHRRPLLCCLLWFFNPIELYRMFALASALV